MISAHDDSERINIAKVRVLRSIDSCAHAGATGWYSKCKWDDAPKVAYG
jgi:hypothetical protein